MKISELITELRHSLDTSGDVTVLVASDAEGNYLRDTNPTLSVDIVYFDEDEYCYGVAEEDGEQAVTIYPIG